MTQRLAHSLWSRLARSISGDERARNILREFHAAENELIGKPVVMSDGKAGAIDGVDLDTVHGLRISIKGHHGHWPISTIKHMLS